VWTSFLQPCHNLHRTLSCHRIYINLWVEYNWLALHPQMKNNNPFGSLQVHDACMMCMMFKIS
jgi:hypothetical protein